MHKLWREVGLLRDRQIVDLDVWAEYESKDGRRLTFWRDLDRLEAHLCELAPADATLIRALLKDARRLATADMPADAPPRELMRPLDMLRLAPKMLPWIGPARRWGKLSIAQLLDRFQDGIVRDALRSFWPAEIGAMALLSTFAWLHAGAAGYPIGGSLPLARNVERRYAELGGEIRYGTRVAEILTERTGGADRVSGVRLADGTEERAEVVISAADGHATIYEMLGARYRRRGAARLLRARRAAALPADPVHRRRRGARRSPTRRSASAASTSRSLSRSEPGRSTRTSSRPASSTSIRPWRPRARR